MPNDPGPMPLPGTREWDQVVREMQERDRRLMLEEQMRQAQAARQQFDTAAIRNTIETDPDWTTQRPIPTAQPQATEMEGGEIPTMPEPAEAPRTRTGRRQAAPRTVPTNYTTNLLTGEAYRGLVPPREPQVQINNVVVRDVMVNNNGMEYIARFTTPGDQVDLAISVYPDVPRNIQPYANALMRHLLETTRTIMHLPDHPVRQVPNATIGERLYNMLGLLMDKDGNEAMQTEWDTLRAEYENYMAGGRW